MAQIWLGFVWYWQIIFAWLLNGTWVSLPDWEPQGLSGNIGATLGFVSFLTIILGILAILV